MKFWFPGGDGGTAVKSFFTALRMAGIIIQLKVKAIVN